MWMVAWPQVSWCPPLELRCILVCLSGKVGLGWGRIAWRSGELFAVTCLNPTLLPPVCALRKGKLQGSWSHFHKVSAESRPSFAAWVTKGNRAEDRVTTPTSVQGTAWFWNSGGLKGIRGHFGTLKVWSARTPEAQGLKVGLRVSEVFCFYPTELFLLLLPRMPFKIPSASLNPSDSLRTSV